MEKLKDLNRRIKTGELDKPLQPETRLLRKYRLCFTALHEISVMPDEYKIHTAKCLARGAMQAAINLGDTSDS